MKTIARFVLVNLFVLIAAVPLFAQWVQTNGPYGGGVNCFAVNDTNLYAGTNGGVFLSTDYGTSWTNIGFALSGLDVMCLATCPNGSGGTNLFAGCADAATYGGCIFLSTDNGTSWTKVFVDNERANGLGYPVNCLTVLPDGAGGTNIFAGTEHVTFCSTDNGTTWTNLYLTWPQSIKAIAASPNGTGGTNLFACNGSLHLSTDTGTSWSYLDHTKLPPSPANPNPGFFTSLAVGNNGVGGVSIIAGTSFNISLMENSGAVLSTDYGTSWCAVDSGFPIKGHENPIKFPYPYPDINALVFSDTDVFAGTTSGVFMLTDNNTYWSAVNSGLTDTTVTALAAIGTHLFAGTNSGVFISTNKGSSWSKADLNIPISNITAIAAKPDGMGGTALYAGTNAGVFLSTNNGGEWNAANSGLTDPGINTLLTKGSSIYAATNSGVFLSTNNGTSWVAQDSGIIAADTAGKSYITTMATNGLDIFAGGFAYPTYKDTIIHGQPGKILCISAHVYHLANNETIWSHIPIIGDTKGGELDVLVFDSISTGNTAMYAITGNQNAGYGGIYRTTDNGANWVRIYTPSDTSTQLPRNNFLQLGFVSDGKGGTNIVAASFYWYHVVLGEFKSGMYLSTDNGTSWNATVSSTSECKIGTSFAVYGGNIFSGSNLGVSLSTDRGLTWTTDNSGLVDLNVKSLFIDNGYLYAGTHGGGIWRRPISEFPVGVEENNSILPSVFRLLQNYPNPFNPSTTIKYDLPKQSRVKLVVYDLLGREVATLVDETKKAGSYQAIWNASRFASGVYFYKLDAGTYHDTKKLLLLK